VVRMTDQKTSGPSRLYSAVYINGEGKPHNHPHPKLLKLTRNRILLILRVLVFLLRFMNAKRKLNYRLKWFLWPTLLSS
jgi:hypothetical protein